MKRLYYFVVICLITIGFVNCGQKNTPSSVTETAVKCLQKKDFKGYLKYAVLPEESVGKEDQMASVMEQMVGNVLDQKGGLKDFEILGESIDESNGSAIVKVKYIYGNEPEYIQQFNLIRNEEGQWKLNFRD